MGQNSKWLIAFVCIILCLAFKTASPMVLICVSPTSYAYHTDYCQGLNKCTHEVVRVTLNEAINKYGKTKPCGYCY